MCKVRAANWAARSEQESMMKKEIIKIPTGQLDLQADELFIQNCGLREGNEKHKKMYQTGKTVLDAGRDGIKVTAIVSCFPGYVYKNHRIQIDGINMTCPAFTKISDENVQAVYFYMITAGECTCHETEPISKRLFADIWGSAYVDAGRIALGDIIRKHATEYIKEIGASGGFVSNSFGPGFYGMNTAENRKLHEILSGQRIGVNVRDTGIMLPMKTCSGIYLVVSDAGELPKKSCISCEGNSKGCALCHANKSA